MSEELKDVINRYHGAVDMALSYGETLPYYEIDIADMNHLIEQTERVQELEKEYEVRQVCYLEEHIERLEQQNKRYREAIDKMRELLKGRTDYILQNEVNEIIKALEGEE